MLSALLGAICAASLAFAPALVQPSSNLSNNDGDISTVHRAYYDADSVAEYGTSNGKIYNYTDGNLFRAYNTATTNVDETTYLGEGLETTYNLLTGSTSIQIVPTTGETTFYHFASISNSLDIYVDGVLNQTIDFNNLVEEYYVFQMAGNGLSISDTNHYIWVFDHYVVPPYELGTDTVADIAEGLTSGIGTVATGIGGGLQSLMQNIFLVGTVDSETGAFTATGLSTFGIVTVVFCGLALALGLSRWIVNFVGSVGARDR